MLGKPASKFRALHQFCRTVPCRFDNYLPRRHCRCGMLLLGRDSRRRLRCSFVSKHKNEMQNGNKLFLPAESFFSHAILATQRPVAGRRLCPARAGSGCARGRGGRAAERRASVSSRSRYNYSGHRTQQCNANRRPHQCRLCLCKRHHGQGRDGRHDGLRHQRIEPRILGAGKACARLQRGHRHERAGRPAWVGVPRLVVLVPVDARGALRRPPHWGTVYPEFLLASTHRALRERSQAIEIPGDVGELMLFGARMIG